MLIISRIQFPKKVKLRIRCYFGGIKLIENRNKLSFVSEYLSNI